jgi:1,4-dihydroxy-2-naphthoate octaprenyltransferase
LIEAVTVFTNEYYDLEADRLNNNVKRFTGGSRMLVEGKISIIELKFLILFVMICLTILSSYLFVMTSYSKQVLFLLILGISLGVGYTTPPLKLSYRGLGELDVAFIHGFYVIVCGYVFQNGILDNVEILFLSIPLFFSSLAGVSLAGIPDINSDRSVSKKSISVVIGPKNTLTLSLIFSLATGIAGLILWQKFISYKISYLYLILPIYCIFLLFIQYGIMKSEKIDSEIDILILVSMFLIALSSFIPIIMYSI